MSSKATAFAPEQEPKLPVLRPVHGIRYRLEEAIPVGPTFQPGRFGRIFPVTLRRPVDPTAIGELAQAMLDPAPDSAEGDNQQLPSGFTYFGQFVDHDMTFDPTPVPEQIVDPTSIHNFRTPALDLDCIYGLGPAAQPYLYEAANPAKLLLGVNSDSPDAAGKQIKLPGDGRFDLSRNSEGFALIGDPRNDENLVVAQLHLAFLKFHNCVADLLEPNAAQQPRAFNEIRRTVTWHYQWIVLHDFVRRIVRPEVLDDVLKNGRKFYRFDTEPFIPVEFSVAAYRFGHSMVRNNYDHNRVFGPGAGRLAPASLALLFFFTGPRKQRGGGPASTPLPSNWVIDWRRFFELSNGATPRNLSRVIDTRLASALHDLIANTKVDSPPTSLAERNLRRGEAVALPTGQQAAGAMSLPVLGEDQIAGSGPDGAVAAKHGLHKETPLWYYILKEAQLQQSSLRLGEVGSRIVAEVFVGLIQGDPLSFLAQNPTWKPTLPAATPGTFTLADMLKFVESKTPIINPVGD